MTRSFNAEQLIQLARAVVFKSQISVIQNVRGIVGKKGFEVEGEKGHPARYSRPSLGGFLFTGSEPS